MNDDFNDDDFFEEDPPNDPFDEDNDLPKWQDYHEEEQLSLLEILQDLGIQSFDEIVVSLENVDPDTIRGDRFATLEEAIFYLIDIGVVSFSNVIYIPNEDLFAAAIPDESP